MSQSISIFAQTENLSVRKAVTFIVLALGLGWGLQAAAILSGVDFNQLDDSSSLVWLLLVGIAWAPGMAALVTQMIYQRSLRGLQWGRRPIRMLGTAVLLPLLFIVLSYGLSWLASPASFAPAAVLPAANGMLGSGWAPDGVIILLYQLLSALLYLLPIGVFALGEEIGWSGLLIPQLRRETSFRKTAVLFGAVWSLYHLPLMLFADYAGGVPLWYGVLVNVVVLMGFAVTLAWLCLRSQSLWPPLMAHTLWNVLIFYIFEPVTSPTSLSVYLVGEKGAATAVLVLITTLFIWRRERQIR